MPDNNMLQTIGMASNPNFDPAEYARQQQAMQLGQALMAQGMQAPEGQMVSGHYIAPAATQQLARLVSMIGGNKMATGGNEYMMRTNIGNTQAMLNSLPGSNQGAMPAAGTPPGGAAPAAPFSPVGYPQAQASSPDAASSGAGYSPMAGQAGNNPFTRENVIQSMILNGFSPEAAKAFWARTAPAPTQEQLNAYDPGPLGQLTQGNLRTQNMTNDQKLIEQYVNMPDSNPMKKVLAGLIQKAQTQVVSGGQSLYGFGGNGPALAAVAPTDKAQYAVGGDGSVIASGIPGAPEIAGTMAASTSGGSERGRLPYIPPSPVTLPNGKTVDMTPAQRIEGATGVNPLNPVPSNNFGGLRPVGASKGFMSYATPEEGLAALDKDLMAKGARGLNTVSKIISVYAPSNENNTQAYIKAVSQRLGVDPNQPLNMNSPAVRQMLAGNIMLQEHPELLRGQPKPNGMPVQSPTEAEVQKQKTDAAVQAAKVKTASQPLLNAIDEALSINDKVPYGSFGIADARANLGNVPLIGHKDDATYAGRWKQLMGQFIMNGIASSGLGRMDIPIVNAIKSANGIPMENNPESRKQMLMQLRALVQNHINAAGNLMPALGQPGLMSGQPQPMTSAAPAPGAVMTLDQYLKARGH